MHFDVENLSFSYKDNKVLENVTFSLKDGELISLLGRNGSGKTTLLRLLLGFLSPDNGRIAIDGIDIENLSYKEKAKKIAYIPQYSELTFPTTVLECVVMGRNPMISPFSKPKKKDYEIAQHFINQMGIGKLRDRSISKISGGERQLALIARALTQEARILLLDEPTSALDYSNQLMVLESADKLRKEGYSILFSTHNPEQALMISSSVLLLDNGCSEYYTSPSILKDGERLSKLYNRELFLSEVETGKNRRIVCVPK